MLKDTRLQEIRVLSVMVHEDLEISFSAEVEVREIRCSLWLDQSVRNDGLQEVMLRRIIGHRELYLNIIDPTPRTTIEAYLTPLYEENPPLAKKIADAIEQHLPLLRAKAERAMKAAQAELDRPPEPALRWKKGDRVIHCNRPATVQRAYRTGKVHIVLDSSNNLPAWYVTRIVSAKNLEQLEEVKTT